MQIVLAPIGHPRVELLQLDLTVFLNGEINTWSAIYNLKNGIKYQETIIVIAIDETKQWAYLIQIIQCRCRTWEEKGRAGTHGAHSFLNFLCYSKSRI